MRVNRGSSLTWASDGTTRVRLAEKASSEAKERKQGPGIGGGSVNGLPTERGDGMAIKKRV